MAIPCLNRLFGLGLLLLLAVVPLDAALAENLKVFDIDRQVTKADRGFPWDEPPAAAANGNWLTPLNYAGGTLHMRVEIRGQPVPQSMRLQFCMWQYSLTLETCTSLATVSGQAGTVVTWTSSIPRMWKKNGVDMDWANPRQRYGLAIKNSSGQPVSNFLDWNWSGENPDAWYPLDIKFSVVAVPVGGTFVGWTSEVLAAPPGPVGGVTAASISTQPANQIAIAGQTATFSVVASGTAPLSYQWQRDQVDIAGATGASYTTPATTLVDDGAVFRCRVSNTAGNVTSAGAVLSVSATALISSYSFDEGAGATANDQTGNGYNGTVVGAAWTSAGKHAGALNFDGVDDYVGLGTWGVPGNALTISAWVKGDTWANGDARFIAKAVGNAEPDQVFLLGERDNRLRARLKTNGQTVTLIASSAALPVNTWIHVAAVYDGSILKLYQNGTEVGSLAITGSIGASSAPIHIGRSPEGSNYLDGTLDDVRIYAVALSRDDILADMNTSVGGASTPPSITTGPANQSVISGQTATFSVVASGSAPLSYQWQRDGVDISGATGASYTTPETTPDDDGAVFGCRVTNAAGSATSDSAILTVSAGATPPSITSGPANQSVTSGQTATFSVVASGSAPLSYQWQRDGVDISGATGASYTTPETTPDDDGAVFGCRVTNAAGSVTSGSATLTVSVTGGGGGAWWDDQWRYRVPIIVNAAGFARSDKPVETDINFTSLLSALGATGVFNEASLRVVELASDGSIINGAVPFQFDKDAAYNATSNARGSLVFMMVGTTGSSVSRQFHVYFETASGFSAASVTPQVTVTDNVSHEGQASFRIATSSGTWYYHKQGAGFASLDDVQGSDWIGYRVGGGSAGEYRGIPNLGDVGHPGYTNASTSLLRQGPLRSTLLSRSNDNAWEMTWDLYPGYATLTILKAGGPYWLLYEGTPGGALNLDSDTMTLSSGHSQTLSSNWDGDIPAPEWAYFTDGPTGRYLYFIHHEDDSAPDQYYSMEGNMTVFGLGRKYAGCCTKYLTATPAHLTVGLGENGILPETTIDSAFRPLAVTVSAPETRAPVCQAGETLGLTTTVFGPGSVLRTPDQAAYGCGETVTLTAQPDAGAEFTGWGGALSGTTTPVGLTLEADTTVTAGFAADTTPPVISNVQVTAGQNAATVSWSTDEPSTGVVNYGRSTDYGLSVSSSALATTHSVNLTGLAAGTLHHYRIQATDAAGNSAGTADLSFTTLVAGNVAPTASFSVTPQSGAAPLTVNLNASASSDSDGTLVDYAWDFGDGALGSGVTTSHTYAAAGVYTVQLTVTDDDGAVDTATATVTVLSSGSPGIVSDDFNAPTLDGIWTFQDPVGDGSYELVGAGTPDARLRLSVPVGTNHDVWTGGNRSVRVMQPALNDDFEIEVKFESQPTQRFQLQGLLIEQDAQNFLRVDFYSDGSVLRLFAARFVNGVPTTLRNQTVAAAPTLYLRLTRQGDTWTPQYSYDGVSWIGVSGFTHALAVTSVGVFAGNSGGNPAFTAVVDYFFNTAAPIVPEDGLACAPGETLSLTTTVNGPGSVLRTPNQATYGCGETVTLTAQPGPGAEFTGWGGALSGTTTPVGLTLEADTTVTAGFAADTTPPVISNVQVTAGQNAATVSWSTDEPSTGVVNYGRSTDYGLSVSSSALATTHSVNLTGLAAGTLHHYRIQATDAAGNSAGTADLSFTTLVAGNVAPTASFSVTPQSGAAPLTVNLNASASSDSDGTLVDYAWDFGDGALGSGVTTSHTYAAAGVYTVQLTVTDDDGAVDTATATVTVLSSGSPGIVSDDFNAPTLDGIWTFQDPVGDGSYELVGAGTPDARLRLSVPVGTNHDVWTGGNRSVRVMQPALNDDFEIEVKFESQPTQRFQLQGLLIEQDAQNFLRVDFYSDGSVLRLFAARFVNGVPTTLRNQTVAAAPTLYLRLTRQGDTWTPQYSYDGVSWIGVSGFTHALAVTSVGVFAGNSGGNPAFTAVVDYFFNTAAPIVPEDGLACAPGETLSLTTTVNGPGSVLRTPNQATYGCGETVTLTAQPGPGAEFTGWGGALSGTTTPVGLTLEADTTVTAGFAADTTPPVISNVQVTAGQTAATVSWTTNEPSAGVVAYGESPAYELGSAASPLGTSHSVSLTGLAAGTGHHYQIQATDAAGNRTSTTDRTFTTLVAGNSPPLIDVWYGSYQPFGYLGVPQRWINVLGNVSDPDGISSLSCSLNGGPARPLSIGPDDRRLAEPGDFVIEIDYTELEPEPGLNDVVIAATDSLGSTSVETITVDFGNSGPWPLPYTIDWDTQPSVQDVTQVVDGNWVVTDQGVRTLQIDYDRLLAIGDLDWQNYEITVPVTIHGSEPVSGPVSGAPGVGIILRWTGHTNSPVVCAQPHCGWLPSGPIAWWRASKLTLADQWDPDVLLQLGIPYIWKLRVKTTDIEGQRYHIYSLKVWQAGENEPSPWNLTKTYLGGTVTNGSALLIAHHMDVTFGDMTIVSLDNVIPPVISNVQAVPSETTAIITWTTNEPATSRVAYGFTSSHEAGTIVEDTLKTSHSLMLTDLEPGTLYHSQVSSLSSDGALTISQNFTFKTRGGQDLSGIVSDDFNTLWLNPFWEYQDPVGDGAYELVGAGTENAHLRLSVPAGASHDVWTGGNRSVRVMQPSLDENLEIEVKFESQPTQRFQMQGLLVEQDPQNFLRVDFYSDGSSLRLFAARFTGGVPQTLLNQVIAGHPNLYLRLTRQGNIWTPQHSSDGTNWTVQGSFTQVMIVSKVGVFAGNTGSNPAYTAVVDYFFNTASSLAPEDGAGE